jgi:large subunit ribosomal protein L36
VTHEAVKGRVSHLAWIAMGVPDRRSEPGYDEERVTAMKVRNSLRGLKNKMNSIVVRRRGRTFVINKSDRRQKARQG